MTPPEEYIPARCEQGCGGWRGWSSRRGVADRCPERPRRGRMTWCRAARRARVASTARGAPEFGGFADRRSEHPARLRPRTTTARRSVRPAAGRAQRDPGRQRAVPAPAATGSSTRPPGTRLTRAGDVALRRQAAYERGRSATRPGRRPGRPVEGLRPRRGRAAHRRRVRRDLQRARRATSAARFGRDTSVERRLARRLRHQRREDLPTRSRARTLRRTARAADQGTPIAIDQALRHAWSRSPTTSGRR